MPCFTALARILSRRRPAPSSRHLDHDVAAVMRCRQHELARAVLARRAPHLDGFDAVVETVAHEVSQRIDDPLDQALVEFGRLTEGDKLDFLAEFRREIAHEAREAAENVIHRHHADRHHGFLQIARIALELRHAVEKPIVQCRIERARRFGEHRLRDDQFADQVDQLIDLFDADANRAAFARCRSRGRTRLLVVAARLRGGGGHNGLGRLGLRFRLRFRSRCNRRARGRRGCGGRCRRARLDGRCARLRRTFRRDRLGPGVGRHTAADRDLTFVDHKAAHGDDVVRRYVGLKVDG